MYTCSWKTGSPQGTKVILPVSSSILSQELSCPSPFSLPCSLLPTFSLFSSLSLSYQLSSSISLTPRPSLPSSLCFSLLFPFFSLSVTLFHTHRRRLSLWVYLCLTWERTHVPLHSPMIPLPVNPALHVQSNDPIVLLQIACRLHGRPPHSSMSIGGENKNTKSTGCSEE